MVKKKKTEQSSTDGYDGYVGFIECSRQLREFQFNELCEQVRRAGIAARKRRPIVEALAKSGGTDLAAIDKLHDKEWESILKSAKEQEKAVLALMKEERKRQKQVLRTIVTHKDRFEYRRGNPHTKICLWRAILPPSFDIIPQTFNDGVVQILTDPPDAPPINEGGDNIRISQVPVRVGENIARLSVRVAAHGVHGLDLDPAAAVDISTKHVFEASVPHEGELSVTGNYAPLGNIFLGARGDCVLPGEASAEVDISLHFRVTKASGERRHIEHPTKIENKFNHKVEATCDGKSRSFPLSGVNGSAFELSRSNIVHVHEGDTIRVTAGFRMYLYAALRGAAHAIFAPAPFGLNVPMVLLTIAG